MAYELHRDPRSSHQRIARIVRRIGRQPVLDVGASEGQLGQLLSGSGLAIDAIEPDQASARAAARFYRSVDASTVESANLPSNHYKVVVCADVLEHTVDPSAAIQHLLNAATVDATFIMSLPNVGHLAARALLAVGQFPQHDRGIFDRTHLHFYTRKTALELASANGLRVRRVLTTPVPLEEIWPRWLPGIGLEAVMRLQVLAARVTPNLFAFQWIIVATRA